MEEFFGYLLNTNSCKAVSSTNTRINFLRYEDLIPLQQTLIAFASIVLQTMVLHLMNLTSITLVCMFRFSLVNLNLTETDREFRKAVLSGYWLTELTMWATMAAEDMLTKKQARLDEGEDKESRRKWDYKFAVMTYKQCITQSIHFFVHMIIYKKWPWSHT